MRNRSFMISAVLVCYILIGSAFAGSIEESDELNSQIQLIERWVDEVMEYYHIPGVAMGIVHDGDLIWSKAFGYADLEKEGVMTTRTLFRIASITKLFTCVAIMQLRDAGKLRLDDPVRMYLPWFSIRNPYPDAPQVTIRQIMTHTSGLPREAAFPYWTDHDFPSREEIKKALPGQEMVYPPETEFKYSNLAMALLGEIVIAVSGKPYEEYIRRNILDPLGMGATRVELSGKDRKHLATGYFRYLHGKPRVPAPYTDCEGITPAANMASNVHDLAKFCSFQFGYDNQFRKVLKGSTLREMHRVHWLKPAWESGWGLGFSISKTDDCVLVGHGGWVAGFRSQLMFSPEEHVGVIVLMNTEDFSPYRIALTTMQNVVPVVQRIVTPEEEPAVFNPEWERFLGKYTDPWFYDTDVIRMENRMYLYGYTYPPIMEPGDQLIELVPVEGNIFIMTGLNGNGEKVIFEMDDDGTVKQVKIGENYIYPVFAEQ